MQYWPELLYQYSSIQMKNICIRMYDSSVARPSNWQQKVWLISLATDSPEAIWLSNHQSQFIYFSVVFKGAWKCNIDVSTIIHWCIKLILRVIFTLHCTIWLLQFGWVLGFHCSLVPLNMGGIMSSCTISAAMTSSLTWCKQNHDTGRLITQRQWILLMEWCSTVVAAAVNSVFTFI